MDEVAVDLGGELWISASTRGISSASRNDGLRFGTRLGRTSETGFGPVYCSALRAALIAVRRCPRR